MKWNVFHSVSDAREAVAGLEDLGFETAGTLRQTLRLTHRRQSDDLHARTYCEGAITKLGSKRNETPANRLQVSVSGEYDHSSGWTDYRLGELLSGHHKMCEVCTPYLIYGAMEGVMSFGRAVLDAESLSDASGLSDKKVLESAFHCFYLISSAPAYCSPDRAERAMLSCKEAARRTGDRYISELVNTTSTREIASTVPRADQILVRPIDSETDQKGRLDTPLLGPPGSLENLSVIVHKNTPLSTFVYIHKKPPLGISAAAAALSGGELGLLCTGGITIAAPGVVADSIVSDDVRAVVLATTDSPDADRVTELTNALSLFGGELSDPLNSLRSAAGILGVSITLVK